MDDKTFAEYCARKALEKKAENVIILSLEGKSSVTDYFVIASGSSDRQVSAIAEHVADSLRLEGFKPLSTEGLVDGRWALIDFGSVIVHVFQEGLRDFYNLESLWPAAPRQWVVEESDGSTTYGSSSGHAHM